MLTDRQCDLLAFERETEGATGNREAAVRERFGVSFTRYYQELHATLDSPAALEHDPMLVHRLERIRAARRGRRAARQVGTSR